MDAHIVLSLLRKAGHIFMWLSQATEGQSLLSADGVCTLYKNAELEGLSTTPTIVGATEMLSAWDGMK